MNNSNTQEVLDILDWLLGVKKEKPTSETTTNTVARAGQEKVKQFKEEYRTGQEYDTPVPIVNYDGQYYYRGITPVLKEKQANIIQDALADIVNFISPRKRMLSPVAPSQELKDQLSPRLEGGGRLNPDNFLRAGEVEQYDKNLQELINMGNEAIKKMGSSKVSAYLMRGITRLGGEKIPVDQMAKLTIQPGQVLAAEPESTPTPIQTPLEGIKFGNLIAQIWPKEEWGNVPRVIAGENRGMDPNIVGHNPDGTIDIGLMQINSNTFVDFMLRKEKLLAQNGITNFQDMFDPVKNLKMAYLIFQEGGWARWYGAPPDLRGR